MLASGLPEEVHDEEYLARFLPSSSYFNRAGIKPSAFLPRDHAVDVSVFRHDGNPRAELWELGDQNLSVRRIYGVGIVRTGRIRLESMDVAAFEPPPRHANIVGWRLSDDPELQLAMRKEQAAAIAQHAELIEREDD